MKYAKLPNSGVIRIGGEDAIKFLNAITTNKISASTITYSLMLSPQGRYIADFFVYPFLDESLLLEVSNLAKTRVLDLLKKYKMRKKIDIKDVSEHYFVVYSTSPAGQISYKDPRHPKLQYKNLLLQQENNLLQIGQDFPHLYLSDKYELTIPEGETELTFEKSFPQEYGLDLLNAISYTKGCYVGQEVISRTKYQGVVRKKVYYLQSDEHFATQDVGRKITKEGKEIGTICSCYQNKAIALIREEDSKPFANAQLGSAELQIHPASWYI